MKNFISIYYAVHKNETLKKKRLRERLSIKITQQISRRFTIHASVDSLRTWLHSKRFSMRVNLFSISYSSRVLDKLHLGSKKGVLLWSNAKHQTRHSSKSW